MALLDDVTRVKVAGPLEQREPAILRTNVPEQLARFVELVRGAATSVVLLTGYDPPAGPVRDLAVEAIVLETASKIEYAEYPEQQAPGLDGRGYYLHQAYLEKLAELRAIITAAGGFPVDGTAGAVLITGLPQGRFPAASAYPDPIIVRGVATERTAWEIP